MSRIMIPQPVTTSALDLSRPLGGRRINSDLPETPVAPPHPTNPDQISLIGAPQACRVTYQDVAAVPVPDIAASRTREASWHPLPWASAIDGLRDRLAYELDEDPLWECYALGAIPKGTKDLTQAREVFGMIGFPSKIEGVATIGIFQGSYNKQMKNTWGLGHAPFVCANKQIHGADLLGCRSTAGVWGKADEVLAQLVLNIEAARIRAQHVESYRQIPMTEDLFHAYLGLLLGRDIITSRVLANSRRYWKRCHAGLLHDDHGDHSLYSAYQAVTGAGGALAPRSTMNMYAGLSHVTDAIAASGGSMESAYIPEFRLEIADIDDDEDN